MEQMPFGERKKICYWWVEIWQLLSEQFSMIKDMMFTRIPPHGSAAATNTE